MKKINSDTHHQTRYTKLPILTKSKEMLVRFEILLTLRELPNVDLFRCSLNVKPLILLQQNITKMLQHTAIFSFIKVRTVQTHI